MIEISKNKILKFGNIYLDEGMKIELILKRWKVIFIIFKETDFQLIFFLF